MAKIGVIGGSGFYTLLERPKLLDARTAYGIPSDKIALGSIEGREIAFIPRHGSKHTLAPHKVPYRANIQALSELGVERVIATNAVGSLRKDYKPGDIVIFDQFINFTNGRDDTFFNKYRVAHVSTADPFCKELREIAIEEAEKMKLSFHSNGTVVIINGPRFSTKAESRMFRRLGADLINMTLYPEVALAREKALCYLGIGVITDYDSGLEEDESIAPVSYKELNRIFKDSIPKVKELISRVIRRVPEERNRCDCKDALNDAFVETA
ncbi:MAG: 5'-methylthioadenosine phosphorylase [Candidatus Micrarchaeota archaeon]|nr:MAG: 5'-methylthioadenosine phosphorylase [Candidatus Micrarchaeota archaeon]